MPVAHAAGSDGGDPVVCRHDAIKRHYLDADWDGFLEQYRGLPLNECPHVHFLLARTLLHRDDMDLMGYARWYRAQIQLLSAWAPHDLLHSLLLGVGYTSTDADRYLSDFHGLDDSQELGAELMTKLAEKRYPASIYEKPQSFAEYFQLGKNGPFPDDEEKKRLGYGVEAGSLRAARYVVFMAATGAWDHDDQTPTAAEDLLLGHANDGFVEAAVWLTAAYDEGDFGGKASEKARRMKEIASTRWHWPAGSPIPLPSGMTAERLKEIGKAVASIYEEIPWSDGDAPVKGSRLCDPRDGMCVYRLYETYFWCQMRNMALIDRVEVLASKLHERCIVDRMALHRGNLNSYFVPHRIAPVLPRLPYERDITQ